MTVSIVIPTYNGARFVEDAIQSAINQTRPADEILISDDNSIDNTLEICSRYSNKVRVIKNPNGPSGFVNGWKNAIANASCDFITILHQDDLLSPTYLEEMEKAVRANPDVKHFFTPCKSIDEYGNERHKEMPYLDGHTHRYTGQEYALAYERIKGHIHRCPGVMTHRDIFKVCNYRESAGHIADDDFFLRVGNFTDVVGVLKPLASYREHSGSETGHLDFFKLNERLLTDYRYQLDNRASNPLINDEISTIFQRWENEYIHRLFIFGLKGGQWKSVGTALRHYMSIKILKSDLRFAKAKMTDIVRWEHIKHLKRKADQSNELSVSGRLVIVAPHPDDEVIGCGGLIAKLVSESNVPHIVVMTGGEGSHGGCCNTSSTDIIKARRSLTRKALGILGVPESHIHELNFPDGDISADDAEIEKLQAIINEIQPDRIFVPHWGEGWSDHVKTAEIVKRIEPAAAEVWEYCVWMWYYNVWRGLDWKNARALHLTPEQRELKLRAMDAYIKPLAPCGRPWSGQLPKMFIKANSGDIELYFKCGISK